MKEIADELSRLRKLSIHPWVQLTMEETETQGLLRGSAHTSFETESSVIGYPGPDSAKQPINPVSSFYAR